MKQLIFIAVGGAGGALARYWLSAAVSTLTHSFNAGHFPWGTLLVNVLGSFGMGVMYVLITEKMALHADWRAVAMVGFLGAFTTFSTFSLEAVVLLERGDILLALAYVAASVIVCLLALAVAMYMMRALG